MKLKSKLSSRIAGLIATGLSIMSMTAAQAETINVTTASGGTPINLINGGQFEFFAPPVRSKMKSEDMFRTWKSIPLRLLRYPGGTVCDHYIWNNPSAGHFVVGNANTVISPAQFIEMCKASNAEPIFQVNTMSVDKMGNRINPNQIETIKMGAKRAAEWVYDANIKNKWNVKYWEIGNETWIWLFGKEYAQYVVEYSKAMKAVDPNIKIIACGLDVNVGPFNPDSFFNFSKTDPTWKPRTVVNNDAKSWNEALFTIAKGSFDYIAPHPYLSALEETSDIKGMYLETTKKIWKNEKMQTQYDILDKYAPTNARIAITEWACNFRYSVPGSSGKIPPTKGYYYMLGNGINMAYYFGRLLEDPRNELAIAHSLCDLQTLWYWPKKELAKGEPLEHPALLELRVWNNNLGSKRMNVKTDKMPELTIGKDHIPAVYLFASENDSYRYLVIINLDPDNARSVAWKTAEKEATVTRMAGATLDTQNFDAWEQSRKPVEIATSNLTAANGAFTVELPKHSMVAIKVKK